MPRGLTTAQIEAISQRVVGLAHLVYFDFPDDPLYAWDGYEQFSWGGHIWMPTGQFGMIEGIETDTALRSSRITVGLVNLPSQAVSGDFVTRTRGVSYQRRALSIYRVPTHPDTGLPVTDPFLVWNGLADAIAFKVGSTINVTLSGEHYAALLRRVSGWRCTIHSHNQRLGIDPASDDADLFFEHNTRLNSIPTKI